MTEATIKWIGKQWPKMPCMPMSEKMKVEMKLDRMHMMEMDESGDLRLVFVHVPLLWSPAAVTPGRRSSTRGGGLLLAQCMKRRPVYPTTRA